MKAQLPYKSNVFEELSYILLWNSQHLNFCLSLCTDLNACYVYKTLPRLAVRHSRSAKNPGICWSWSCSSTRLFLFFSQCAESITTSLSTSWNKQVLSFACKFTYLFMSTLTNSFNSYFHKHQVSTKHFTAPQLLYFSSRYPTCLRKSSIVWNVYIKCIDWNKIQSFFSLYLSTENTFYEFYQQQTAYIWNCDSRVALVRINNIAVLHFKAYLNW